MRSNQDPAHQGRKCLWVAHRSRTPQPPSQGLVSLALLLERQALLGRLALVLFLERLGHLVLVLHPGHLVLALLLVRLGLT